MRKKLLTMAGVFVLGAASLLAQATQTFTGTVTDSMCGAHHAMMKNATDAQCTRACIQHGASYALATKDGKVYMLTGSKSTLDKLAGDNVRIRGTVSGNTIAVKSIQKA